jgi:hypothetical protein
VVQLSAFACAPVFAGNDTEAVTFVLVHPPSPSARPARLVAKAEEERLSFQRQRVSRCGLRSLSYCRPTLMSFPRAPTQNPSLVA